MDRVPAGYIFAFSFVNIRSLGKMDRADFAFILFYFIQERRHIAIYWEWVKFIFETS